MLYESHIDACCTVHAGIFVDHGLGINKHLIKCTASTHTAHDEYCMNKILLLQTVWICR